MKCVRQPRFLLGKAVQIANLIEVHVAAGQWRTIVHMARKRGWTFSMMTRFCVLRLASKTRIEWMTRLKEAHGKAKLRNSILCNRRAGKKKMDFFCLPPRKTTPQADKTPPTWTLQKAFQSFCAQSQQSRVFCPT
jgi:hypothetical protein